MWICLARHSSYPTPIVPTLHIYEASSPAWSAAWLVGLPVCFSASPSQHTYLDIPVVTTAKKDTCIRMLLFLVLAWMTAGFPQTSIISSEADIWWSCCQVYSYPHSRNNPLFISLLVFLAFTLFRKAHVGVQSQWSIIMILPLHSAFALLFKIFWWHISLFKTMEAKRTYGPYFIIYPWQSASTDVLAHCGDLIACNISFSDRSFPCS